MYRYTCLLTLCAALSLNNVASAQYRYNYRADRDGATAQETVRGWYRQFLDRDPDPGARTWIQALRQGQDARQVLSGILASDEYYQKAGGTARRFVRQMYRDLTGAVPRDGRYWNLVEQAEFGDRAEVADELLEHHPGPWQRSRPESQAEERQVAQWYQRYLGRAPQPTEIHYAADQLELGTPAIYVLSEILASPEYYRRMGGTPERFVLGIYRELSGQVPDGGTIEIWAARVPSADQRRRLATSLLNYYQGWPLR